MKGINEPLILSHCAKVTYTIETYINELRNVGYMAKRILCRAISTKRQGPFRKQSRVRQATCKNGSA